MQTIISRGKFGSTPEPEIEALPWLGQKHMDGHVHWENCHLQQKSAIQVIQEGSLNSSQLHIVSQEVKIFEYQPGNDQVSTHSLPALPVERVDDRPLRLVRQVVHHLGHNLSFLLFHDVCE